MPDARLAGKAKRTGGVMRIYAAFHLKSGGYGGLWERKPGVKELGTKGILEFEVREFDLAAETVAGVRAGSLRLARDGTVTEAPPPPDPEKERILLEEAKAAIADGRLRISLAGHLTLDEGALDPRLKAVL
jgi:hypothetical protein